MGLFVSQEPEIYQKEDRNLILAKFKEKILKKSLSTEIKPNCYRCYYDCYLDKILNKEPIIKNDNPNERLWKLLHIMVYCLNARKH